MQQETTRNIPRRNTQNYKQYVFRFCNGRALDRVGSPHKSIDQIGKTCPKNVRKLCFQPLQTIFGHFSDIFSTFFGHFFDIFRTFCRHSLFLGCPTLCPLQFRLLFSWCFQRFFSISWRLVIRMSGWLWFFWGCSGVWGGCLLCSWLMGCRCRISRTLHYKNATYQDMGGRKQGLKHLDS